MDFRNTQPGQPGAPVSAPTSPTKSSSKRNGDSLSGLLRGGTVALLFGLTVLVVAIIGILIFGSKDQDQSKFVNKGEYQAVFLTNGQVYFGNTKAVTGDYIQLSNVYYLTQNTSTDTKGNTTTDGNYTLVKLGCQQIHDPEDSMLIERSQVSFWENLKSDGKVVKSIKQFQQQNPKGPDCS